MMRLNKELAAVVAAADALADEYLLRALWSDRNHEQTNLDDPVCVAAHLAERHLDDRELGKKATRLSEQLTATLTAPDDQRVLWELRKAEEERRYTLADAGFAFGVAIGRRLSGGAR